MPPFVPPQPTQPASESPWKALKGESCKPKPHKRQDQHWRAVLALQKLEGRLGPSHFQQVRRVGRGDVGSVHLVKLKGSNLQFAMKARPPSVIANMPAQFQIARPSQWSGLSQPPPPRVPALACLLKFIA